MTRLSLDKAVQCRYDVNIIIDKYIGKGKKVSPTILREKGYRFFFFSREEIRMHVHVVCSDGEAKFWLIPEIELAKNYNLSRAQLKEIESIIEVYYDEFKSVWEKHFGG